MPSHTSIAAGTPAKRQWTKRRHSLFSQLSEPRTHVHPNKTPTLHNPTPNLAVRGRVW